MTILSSRTLPVSGPYPTMDPFLFCVYHKDQYPAATNDTMEAPRIGNGQDFDPSAVSASSMKLIDRKKNLSAHLDIV